MADSINISTNVSIDRRPKRSKGCLTVEENVHQVLVPFANMVAGFLHGQAVHLCEHSHDVVAFEAFSLLHVVRVDVLLEEQSVDGYEPWHTIIGKAYIGPADHIYRREVEGREVGVLDDLIRQVNPKDISTGKRFRYQAIGLDGNAQTYGISAKQVRTALLLRRSSM